MDAASLQIILQIVIALTALVGAIGSVIAVRRQGETHELVNGQSHELARLNAVVSHSEGREEMRAELTPETIPPKMEGRR